MGGHACTVAVSTPFASDVTDFGVFYLTRSAKVRECRGLEESRTISSSLMVADVVKSDQG